MKLSIFTVTLVLSFSCTNPTFDSQFDLPIIKMERASDIDSTGVALNAIVYHRGNEEVVRSSFNWYPKEKKHTTESQRFIIDADWNDNNAFRVRVDRDMIPNVEYEARFIVQLANQKIYSPTIQFTGQGAAYEPIKVNSRFDFKGTSNSVARQGPGKIFINYGIESHEKAKIQVYDEKLDKWNDEVLELSTRDINNIFYASDEYLLTILNSTTENQAIGVIKDFDLGVQKISGINLRNFNRKFNFVIDNICYGQTNDWRLTRFNIEDYNGLEIINQIPFPSDASKYYAFEIEETAYIHFSEDNRHFNTEPNKNQFWKFNTLDLQWEQLPSYPGTGKDFFAVATDNERYIYVGMGMNGWEGCCSLNSLINEGDIWRFDTKTNTWEMLGWFPIIGKTAETFHFKFDSSREVDGKIYLITLSRQVGHQVISVNKSEIKQL